VCVLTGAGVSQESGALLFACTLCWLTRFTASCRVAERARAFAARRRHTHVPRPRGRVRTRMRRTAP
jgi:hypothetical protein